MKNLIICVATLVALVSCDVIGGGNRDQLKAENDSLVLLLTQRNAELDEMLGTFNDISEGFRLINAAENRVDLNRYAVGEGSQSAKEKIADDIEFIRKQMEENREQIAKLQQMLKESKSASAQLKRAVEQMSKELEDKTQRIEELQAELVAKNIRIQELDDAVNELTAYRQQLEKENAAKAATIASQDRDLNTAWFVFGTESELKEQKIIKKGGVLGLGKKQVLQEDDVNLDYFTKIDIRTTNQIRLYSKSAKVLTNHPNSSYALEKDDKGEITLKITNVKDFWSVSRYLVIQVK
ncbi:MAG: hypothetical protein ACI4CA_09385 [Bacteroides sp.]